MKKNVQNKSKFIQFRVDSEVKNLAKQTANEFFGGNMSDMFRYALYNCNFDDECSNHSTNDSKAMGNSFTGLSKETTAWLATIHEDCMQTNKELNSIGNNINQIAHHVNAQAQTSSSPVTRMVMDELGGINTSLKSIRTTNANKWKTVKGHFTNDKNDNNL